MQNANLIGISRQMALRRELEVVSNNIANLNTTGFKADTAVFEEFLMPRASSDHFTGADRKVSFVQDSSTWHDHGQGAIKQTGNPLDVAIDGSAFLVVQTPRGERYTRNGSMQINPAGELVTTEGHKVLGDGGPIQFQTDDKDIAINRDGTVTVPGGTRGKLRLVQFDNVQRLQKDGSSTFKTPAGVRAQSGADTACHPGRDRAIQRQKRNRDDAHDRGHAPLHADVLDVAATARHAALVARQACGCTRVTTLEERSCEPFTPRRPE